VTSTIIGPRAADQLEENLAGFRLGLPDRLAGRLDDISRGGAG
jgi:aryl-alcohol dehydrogenase-like predicted oxidoreductase